MVSNLWNVIRLGLGFMFVYTAYVTTVNILELTIYRIRKEDPTFTGDGYISQAIINGVFAFCNWLAPSVISIIGSRIAMLIGAVMYILYVASFLWPNTTLLYALSVCVGVTSALLWTGEGDYLCRCSGKDKIMRNAGIFWGLLQMSLLLGNIFVYFELQGETKINESIRQTLFKVLTGVGAIGIIIFATLKLPREDETSSEEEEEVKSVCTRVIAEIKTAFKLFLKKKMLLLVPSFMYAGMMSSMYDAIYVSAVGFTLSFGSLAKPLVGLCGICIGLGEVLGAFCFVIYGKRITIARRYIVGFGLLLHLLSWTLSLLNLPNAASIAATEEVATFNPPIPGIAMFCGFIIGFGDACIITQLYSLLCCNFVQNYAAAFAVFNFSVSIGSTMTYAYSAFVGFHVQLAVLTVVGVFALVGISFVERMEKLKK